MSWDLARSARLHNFRHHRVRSLIAQALLEKHLTVHEEVPGIADNGSTRRIDIIAEREEMSVIHHLKIIEEI